MIIAYLCNRYPAVSHSFVRREIAGIEALGHQVLRFTVRPGANLADPADRAEAELTTVLIARPFTRLLVACLSTVLSSPLAFAQSFAIAWRAGSKSGRRLRNLAYLVEACLLARLLGKARAAHLHAHFGTNPAAVARLVRSLGGPPYSVTVHGPDEYDAPGALDLRGKIAEAKFTVGISDFGRSQLMRWSAPQYWDQIKVVRCGVDDSFLSFPVCAPFPSAPILCCVARLSAQKGLPLLLEATAELVRQGIVFRLVIIGEGEDRHVIERCIADAGLTAVVELWGSKSGIEVREALLRARALVLPSFAEGLPVVIMESFALRRPVVTTGIAGIPELVDDSCGWVVRPGSVAGLAVAMRDALTASTDRLEAMGLIGRQRVVEEYDSSKNAATLVALMLES